MMKVHHWQIDVSGGKMGLLDFALDLVFGGGDDAAEALNAIGAQQPGIMDNTVNFITSDPQAPDCSGHAQIVPSHNSDGSINYEAVDCGW